MTVVALHWNVGEAHVYTLTVAKDHDFRRESGPSSGDHDFFVGSAQVLVHNSNCSDVKDLLMPDGKPIGNVKAGSDPSIRDLTGGLTDAQAMFDLLRRDGTVVQQTPVLTRVELPGGGFVQLRTVMSRSPNTAATIDINIPGISIRKLKFNP